MTQYNVGLWTSEDLDLFLTNPRIGSIFIF